MDGRTGSTSGLEEATGNLQEEQVRAWHGDSGAEGQQAQVAGDGRG